MAFTERVSLRLPTGMLARIDAIIDGRSRNKFLVGVIEAALGEAAGPEKNPIVGPVPVRERTVVWDRPDPTKDRAAVLAHIRGRRYSSRDVEKHFGWLGLRYSKAEAGLLRAGLVRIEDGILEVVK